MLLRAPVEWSVRIRFQYLILWLLLKVPALLQAPQVEAVWLGFGELAGLVDRQTAHYGGRVHIRAEKA